MRQSRALFLTVVLATVTIATNTAFALGNIDGKRIAAADSEPHNWLAHGRTYAEDRFSPLKQITETSVEKLGLDWWYDFKTHRGLEASPIVVDGVMYLTGSWSIVYAFDAKKGSLLWTYDPQVPKDWAAKGCCDVVNRGVAVWKGAVYVGTFDGRLVALDAADGKKRWEVNTIDRSKPYTITGAPRIVNDKVLIGNGGAEYGVRGYVSAYNIQDGGLAWRFFTVPGDPSKPFEAPILEEAAKTWKGEWWTMGGGGTVWDSMAYDPELNLIYIGVGNGSPWNRNIRSPGGGDNLFLSSIVALNPDTGEYVWHYQTTPGETWDYTATQQIILADWPTKTGVRKILMQAPKNGFFYILDRKTGELLSAKPYVKMNWATHVDMKTGRPVETEKQYEDEMKITFPSAYGGHNWHPMSYNPETGLVYIPALDLPFMYEGLDDFKYVNNFWNVGVSASVGAPKPTDSELQNKLLAKKLVKGALIAWNPKKQKAEWTVPYPNAWNGGVLSTAGNLVFQGTTNGNFVAYRATDGKKLWETPAQTGIIAPPISYAIDGKQYVAVLAGWGGAYALAGGEAAAKSKLKNRSRLLVYALDSKKQLPPVPVDAAELPEPPPLTASAETIEKGWSLFHERCAVCHGVGAVSGGVLPDLRHMTSETYALFDAIVYGGIYSDKGMIGFSEVYTLEDVHLIREYLISRAHQDRDYRKEKDNELIGYRIRRVYNDIKTSLLSFLLSL